jgi:hypothetical protein
MTIEVDSCRATATRRTWRHVGSGAATRGLHVSFGRDVAVKLRQVVVHRTMEIVMATTHRSSSPPTPGLRPGSPLLGRIPGDDLVLSAHRDTGTPTATNGLTSTFARYCRLRRYLDLVVVPVAAGSSPRVDSSGSAGAGPSPGTDPFGSPEVPGEKSGRRSLLASDPDMPGFGWAAG